MINKRPTPALGTIFHNDRLFIAQKTKYGPNGRPRASCGTRYRVFEITEQLPEKAFLRTTWIGSVPTMQAVKALIDEHCKKEQEE